MRLQKYKSTPSSYLRLKCYDAVNIYEIRTAEISILLHSGGKNRQSRQLNMSYILQRFAININYVIVISIVNIVWVFLEAKTCPVL